MLAAYALRASVISGIGVSDRQAADAVSMEAPVPADRFFPTRVQETTLMLMALSAYDGPYLEDTSDKEVFGITALQVINTGDAVISHCEIQLHCDEITLCFGGEQIPPGVPVVLLERNAVAYAKRSLLGCYGWQSTIANDLYASKQIFIDDRAMGTVIVTNTSGKPLRNIRIYYKNWLSTPGFLVGGIAYAVTIPELKAGQTELLYPYHYAKGYTRVVSVLSDP